MGKSSLSYRQGATVEEMTIEVNKTKEDLDNAERDLRELTGVNNVSDNLPYLNPSLNNNCVFQVLKRSLVIRLDKWHEFRRHIALRCKLVFQYHLSNRGYFGKVLFDHVNQTLQLKVSSAFGYVDGWTDGL